MAGLYNGHILEFPQIRVDCFTHPPPPSTPPWLLPHPTDPNLPPSPAPPAQLFLLTHVHTDHLLGLDNQFTGKLVCSQDTKRMLLRLEAEVERENYGTGVRERPRRKYEGLRARVVDRGTRNERVVDYIEAVPYGMPKAYEIGYEDGRPICVTITLIEANHCPGSTMFLITCPDRAVLHTGDVRADDLFMRSLRRNPSIGHFIAVSTGSVKTENGLSSGRRTLDRMYIDTGAIVGTGDMPDREGVLQDLVEQMSLYPHDTVFFLNVWCFGWEDVVKEVARHFDVPVHVDRYKREIYEAVKSDPFLVACTTLDPTITRFHACERRAKCDSCWVFNKAGERVWNLDKRIVSVNMVEIKTAPWEIERGEFLEKLSSAAVGEGPWPYTIDCPIARHSPLPEIQRLVKLFRPHALSPNTIAKEAQGMDYYLLPQYFLDCLATTDDVRRLTQERDGWFIAQPAYGPAYLRNMELMAKLGITLGTQSGLVGEALALRNIGGFSGWAVGEMVGPTQRGRRAHAAEQVSRAVGLPKLTPEDLKAVMAALTDDHPGAKPFASIILDSGRILRESIDFTRPTRTGYEVHSSTLGYSQEYDTDEEKDHESKRRKMRALGDNDPRPMHLLTRKEPTLSSRITPAQPSNYKDEPEIKPKIESLEPRPPVVRSRPSYRHSLARKSFLVDKEHLRALAMVATEVDDL